MKAKFTLILLAIGALIALVVSVVSCTEKSDKAVASTYYMEVYCDTINIHGYDHEFLRSFDLGHGSSSMCHSPECWCHSELCPD